MFPVFPKILSNILVTYRKMLIYTKKPQQFIFDHFGRFATIKIILDDSGSILSEKVIQKHHVYIIRMEADSSTLIPDEGNIPKRLRNIFH